MNKFERAYIAGFFDGEGTITVACGRKTKKGRIYTLICAFYNSDQEVLEWIQSKIGGTIHIRPKKSPHHFIHRMLYCRNQRELIIWLETLYPFLIIKKEAVNLGIMFLKLREPTKHLHSSHNPITVEQKEILRRIRLENMKHSFNAKPLPE